MKEKEKELENWRQLKKRKKKKRKKKRRMKRRRKKPKQVKDGSMR